MNTMKPSAPVRFFYQPIAYNGTIIAFRLRRDGMDSYSTIWRSDCIKYAPKESDLGEWTPVYGVEPAKTVAAHLFGKQTAEKLFPSSHHRNEARLQHKGKVAARR